MKLKTFTCEHCGNDFQRRNGARVYKHCSRSCAQRHIAPQLRGYGPLLEKWLSEMSEEEAIARLAEHMRKRSAATIALHRGKKRSLETRQKLAVAATGVPNALKGKTFDEFYGTDRAIELRQQHSDSLKSGFASGRLKPTARSKSAPAFRGVRLRSKLEQRAIEMLERRDGLTFGTDLLYEDPQTFVTWTDAAGSQHTYVPDLHNIRDGIVYEVKPAWLVARPTDEMQRKAAAMLASGRAFAYVSDLDLRKEAT